MVTGETEVVFWNQTGYVAHEAGPWVRGQNPRMVARRIGHPGGTGDCTTVPVVRGAAVTFEVATSPARGTVAVGVTVCSSPPKDTA